MKKMLQFLKTTVIGGIVFLVPLVILGVIVGQAFSVAYAVFVPLGSSTSSAVPMSSAR